MSFDKDDSAGYLANHMARLFAAALTRRIAPLGLMPGQFMVLLELWREDGLTQRDLVERLDVEQATIANTLNRMERDGLILREPDAADRRARRVRL
ncbi:MarR family transcriptional regulator, partial [Rhodovulum sulfidophilum]|nr:MarR family transcriptional regulator [Rhodovulum sulfidophilum]